VIPLDNHQEILLRYLSGELDDAESDAVEERLLSDDAFSNAMREARDELLEAYAAGKLDEQQRERIERALIATPEQRDAARFAGALRNHVHAGAGSDRLRQAAGKAKWSRWSGAGLLAACLIIAVCGAAVWRRVHTAGPNSQPGQQVASAQAPSGPPPSARAPGQPAFVLLLGINRTRSSDSVPRVVVPKGARSLKVQILLRSSEYADAYKVLVRNGSGKTQAQFYAVSPKELDSDKFLDLDLPITDLRSDLYTFSIYREKGSPSLITSYQARLVR